MSTTITDTSGGDQYIHTESSDRQAVLHRCFWDSSHAAFIKSGILQDAQIKKDSFHVLEIGCGSGHTTLDLLAQILPEHVQITGVDTDAKMIEEANKRLNKDYASLKQRVQFIHQTGESLSTTSNNTASFDAVWLRFVVIHVPDPIALLHGAVAGLKPNGTLLVEDICADEQGLVCDPPNYAHDLLHRAHIQASLRLGADLSRGRNIGSYMRTLKMNDIHCYSFTPLFGRGMEVQPWTNEVPRTISSREHYGLALKLFQMSFASITTKLRDLDICTAKELEEAQKSLSEIDSHSHDYQIFCMPGGPMFQWWART